MDSTAVMSFAKAILHGDDEHRNWLLEAAKAFEAGEALPPVRGSGAVVPSLMRELTGEEEKIVEQALRDSGQVILHDSTTGPCPTCGFQVRKMGRAKPMVIEED